jgi:hypothetical protein
MGTHASRQLCWAIMVSAAVVFFVAANAMLHQQEPFFSWFYCFAWWCYILFMESFLHIRGARSLLFSAPREFFLLLPISLNIWLIFEAFNFRLHNWSYLNVPPDLATRWAGYAISFATVIPGIFTSKHFLEHLGLFRHQRAVSPLTDARRLYAPCFWLGAVQLALPLIWPRYFFPLVWGGFIFLVEPLNHKLRAKSLLRDWEVGSLRRFLVLLVAGACCGLFWEFWNFWAGAKWVYSVPFVDWLKIFEMPILGFLGFPPFAVECYVMVEGFRLFRSKLEKRFDGAQLRLVWAGLLVVVVVIDCAVFWGMDRWTVRSFRPF